MFLRQPGIRLYWEEATVFGSLVHGFALSGSTVLAFCVEAFTASAPTLTPCLTRFLGNPRFCHSLFYYQQCSSKCFVLGVDLPAHLIRPFSGLFPLPYSLQKLFRFPNTIQCSVSCNTQYFVGAHGSGFISPWPKVRGFSLIVSPSRLGWLLMSSFDLGCGYFMLWELRRWLLCSLCGGKEAFGRPPPLWMGVYKAHEK